MYFSKILSLIFSFAVFTTAAIAHPGHGSEHTYSDGIFHYLTSLDHLIPLLTVLGIILFAILKKRVTSKRILRK
ncbi:MAG: HupE/UreJ family protein [Bacteroidota bacterium]